MKRLGVAGWPVAHSLSPAMQNAALAQAGLGERWRYQLLPVPPQLFEQTVAALPQDGFHGINVTLPHKRAALELARARGGRISAPAAAIGAANTLLFRDDGAIDAHNTDAPALAGALARRGLLRGASVLVLGAGGSARAAVWALRDGGARKVTVWNRTLARARSLCAELGGEAIAVPERDLRADVLVNCTSIGLHERDTLAMLPLERDALREFRLLVDFVYRPGGTLLTHAAAEQGVASVEGLELLVTQGALAFALFTGVEPSLEAMRAAVGLPAPV